MPAPGAILQVICHVMWGRQTSEAEILSGILDVMRVDTYGSGLPAVIALRG
ncbi:hypothetical protein AB3662_12260 [Sorangium cellulosum]|uniref:hypothetical protein n=1 Tax=Sorangium cellulosum TaxID=56 RepID=UPI003D9A8FB7